MRVELKAVTKGRKGRALPETSVAYRSGTAVLAAAETEQRPTVLGLLASGRMVPDSGTVLIDGRADASALRRRIALVDAPDVSDPDSSVLLAGIVSEELMFAGRRSNPLAAWRWLDELGLKGLATTPIANVGPAERLRVLCELAVLRKGVEGIVLVAPDRHGGEPLVWWRLAQEFAARGLAVLVIAGYASEWSIRHEQSLKDIAEAEASLGEALGAFDEREAAWAQSGGAPLFGGTPEITPPGTDSSIPGEEPK